MKVRLETKIILVSDKGEFIIDDNWKTELDYYDKHSTRYQVDLHCDGVKKHAIDLTNSV